MIATAKSFGVMKRPFFSDGPDVIVGLAGSDSISGGDGRDLICGGKGDDGYYSPSRGVGELNGGLGVDKISGGPGNDDINGGFFRLPDSDSGSGDFLYGKGEMTTSATMFAIRTVTN